MEMVPSKRKYQKKEEKIEGKQNEKTEQSGYGDQRHPVQRNEGITDTEDHPGFDEIPNGGMIIKEGKKGNEAEENQKPQMQRKAANPQKKSS